MVPIKKAVAALLFSSICAAAVFSGCLLYRQYTVKGFISGYFTALYDGYTSLQYVDISPYLDMGTLENQDIVIRQKNLVQSRRWIDELGTGYIGREQAPYRVVITKISNVGEYLQVDFHLAGDEQVAYPIFMLVQPYTYSCRLRSSGKAGRHYVIQEISNSFEDEQRKTHGFVLSKEATEDEARAEAINFGLSG